MKYEHYRNSRIITLRLTVADAFNDGDTELARKAARQLRLLNAAPILTRHVLGPEKGWKHTAWN